MANKKFSEFTLKTDPANVDFVVGYDGTDNVRIDPANLAPAAPVTSVNSLTGAVSLGLTELDDVGSDGTNGQVLTTNGSGSFTFQDAGGGGGASDLNGLSDCLVDTDSLYVGEVPSGLSGNPQGNTVLGIDGGDALTSGSNNTFIGNDAGKSVTNTTSNTAIGQNSLGYHNGNNNVAIGTDAMQGASFFSGTGADNVAIGFNAGSGSSPTAFSNSILIGKDAATSPVGRSNYIVLGNSSHTVLQIPGLQSGASNGDVLMLDTATSPFGLKLYASGTTPSDARDKKDIEDLPYGLEFINSLKPRKYIWDNRTKIVETESFDEDGNPITITEEFVANEKGTIGFGFIAQELQEVDNEVLQLVNDSNEDSLRINYSKLVPVLIKAVQELKAEVELLKG